MMFQKQKPWRSEKYLKWIRTQPCNGCGFDPSEPHHLIGVGCMSGMGIKAPDWAVVPLCRKCHDEIHGNPVYQLDQWEMICRTIGAAIDDGVLEIGK